MTTQTFGKYIVTRTLGRGGMAEVYLAHDPILERQVAIKVILGHLTAQGGFVDRFLHEAKLIAALRHPNIVQLFDFDVLHDQPYMVMEYLVGETLKLRLASLRAQGKWIRLNESVRLITDLAAALDYAHARGAIHRDIKPANILFTERDEPVLTDFGIALMLEPGDQPGLSEGIVGTPTYMSPEQAAGKPIDSRSDLYALGVVAYELATGRIPFYHDSSKALLQQHIHDAPPPPRTLNPNLPAMIETVLLKALAKEPSERFVNASTFAQALHAALHGRSIVDLAPDDVTPHSLTRDTPTLAGEPDTTQTRDRTSTPTTGQPGRATTGPSFVAREQELAQLQAYWDQLLVSQGQVCFVTGEAGTGKTALVTEFVRQRQEDDAEVVVAVANCNTQSGVGDPYLPFRELLTRLIGLSLSARADTSTSEGSTNSPTPFHVSLAQSLAQHGADLIDIFVPGELLLARLSEQPTAAATWIEQLALVVQRKARARERATDLEQSHILEQYTNVLVAWAAQQPLLLVVDDLQWVDSASAQLLFHLSRRIGESRILLIGAYRHDEVALGRQGEAHPLEKVVAEIKRYFGTVDVMLHQEDAEVGRRFVDSLLDQEPNRLDKDFRQSLFRHTRGHALFTVELLRTMQEAGDITLDATGRWAASPKLEWQRLPPRVEGVIEERINRLTQELREALTVASVEGEDFTAEVVARVEGIDGRVLVRQLRRELVQQHRLVRAIGRQQIRQDHVSLFRFRHNLFQKYLYNNLDAANRALFHEDVGLVLEELYGEQADIAAVQLAWHFSNAGLPEKARHYLAIAGEQSRRRYANDEALSFLSRAFDLAPETDHAGRYELLLAREKVYDVLGDREAQRQDLAKLEELAEKAGNLHWKAEIALCRTLYADRIDEYREAIRHAQRAIELAATIADVEREAQGYWQWGRGLMQLSDYVESQTKLLRALALADAEQLLQVKADCLRSLGAVAYFLGQYHGAIESYNQALTLYRDVGDRRGEGHLLSNLGLSLRELGAYVDARYHFDQAYRLYQELGDLDGAAHVLVNLGLLSRDQGNFDASHTFYEQALEICRKTEARSPEAFALIGIGDIYKDQDVYDEAITYYKQALVIAQATGDRRQEHLALKELANCALELGDYATARSQYEETLAGFRKIGDRQSECSTLNRLSLLYHRMEEEENAWTYGQAALTIAEEIGDRWLESSSLTKLGHGLAGLGEADAASECYRKAIVLWREQGRPDLALESVAGLAQIALERADLTQAQAYAEELMNGFDDPAFPNAGMAKEFLTCYRVLRAVQDARVEAILRAIYDQVQASAAKISAEAMRRSYLENLPAHNRIIKEWNDLSRSPPEDPSSQDTMVD